MCCEALFKTLFACFSTQEPRQSGREEQQLCESQQGRKSNQESDANGECVVRRNPDSRPSTASAPTISNRYPSSLNPSNNAVPSPRDSQKRDSQFPIAPKISVSFEANKNADPIMQMEVEPVHAVPGHDRTGFYVEKAVVPQIEAAAPDQENHAELGVAEHQMQAVEEQPQVEAIGVHLPIEAADVAHPPVAHEVMSLEEMIVPTATQAQSRHRPG